MSDTKNEPSYSGEVRAAIDVPDRRVNAYWHYANQISNGAEEDIASEQVAFNVEWAGKHEGARREFVASEVEALNGVGAIRRDERAMKSRRSIVTWWRLEGY